MRRKNTILQIALLVLTSTTFAQTQTPAARTVSPGPYSVTVESYRTLPTHTAYHPSDLNAWGGSKNLNVGHGGTYRQPGGGWFGEVAVAWLDYQLKGYAGAAKWFVGSDCRLCKEPAWSVEKKGMQ